jgi:lipopolysaccharide transport system permease protein
MFLSPIFYPEEAVPENFRIFLVLNPLAPALAQIRGVLMWGEVPSFQSWIIFAL